MNQSALKYSYRLGVPSGEESSEDGFKSAMNVNVEIVSLRIGRDVSEVDVIQGILHFGSFVVK